MRILAFFAALLATPALAVPLGANLSGGEFGNAKLSASKIGYGFFYPKKETVDWGYAHGIRDFRVPVRAMRLQPTIMGPLDARNIAGLNATVAAILAYPDTRVIIDFHDYASRNGVKIGTAPWDAAALADVQAKVMAPYKGNARVWLDVQNEPNLGASAWWPIAQDVTKRLRAAGVDNKLVIENSGTASATRFPTSDGAGYALKFVDPNWVVSVHSYFDKSASGTSTYCKAGSSGRIGRALDWAKLHNMPIFIGEWGAYPTMTCKAEIAKARVLMAASPNLIGATWWTLSDGMRYPKYSYGLSGPGKTDVSSAFKMLQ